MEIDLTCNCSVWTKEEDKAFENALAIYSGDICPWKKIAAAVPGRTVDEIKNHFEVLVSDVNAIDSGDVPLPQYADSAKKPTKHDSHASSSRKRNQSGESQSESGGKRKQSAKRESPSGRQEISSRSDGERRRGKLWTEGEHRLFLYGLEKYGKGDWRNISRQCVKTRTPTQVASHAQKYFKRMDIDDKGKKKASIHDITILDDGKLLNQKVSITDQIFGVDGGSRMDIMRYPKFDPLAINLINSWTTGQSDITTAEQLSAEQMIGATGAGLIAHFLPNLQDASISQDPSTVQNPGASGCLIPYCMPNVHGMSTFNGPSTNMTGAADVGFISSNEGILVPQAPNTEHMIQAAEIGFIGDPMDIYYHFVQAPTTEQTGAAGVGASLITNPQIMSTLHGPIPDQVIADGDADSGDPLIDCDQYITTPEEQQDTGEMIENDVKDYIIDFEEFLPEFDLSIFDSLIASPQILEPSTSAVSVPGCASSLSPAMCGLDAPIYGALDPDAPFNMDNLTYSLPPEQQTRND